MEPISTTALLTYGGLNLLGNLFGSASSSAAAGRQEAIQRRQLDMQEMMGRWQRAMGNQQAAQGLRTDNLGWQRMIAMRNAGIRGT